MKNSIFETYNKEIEYIKSDINVNGILIVGSAKNIDLSLENSKVNDIDIFVLVDEGANQERIIKEINGIEFDINYFSKEGVYSFINSKEYFFLKEMKDAKIIYDKNKKLNDIIDMCKIEYNKGPKILSKEDKCFLNLEILSKIERLKHKDRFESFEYKFLTNLYLKELIVAYFSINNKWVPKDKKMIGTLKNDNIELFNLVKTVNENYLYEDLLNVYKYIFKNINILKNIKITY